MARCLQKNPKFLTPEDLSTLRLLTAMPPSSQEERLQVLKAKQLLKEYERLSNQRLAKARRASEVVVGKNARPPTTNSTAPHPSIGQIIWSVAEDAAKLLSDFMRKSGKTSGFSPGMRALGKHHGIEFCFMYRIVELKR